MNKTLFQLKPQIVLIIPTIPTLCFENGLPKKYKFQLSIKKKLFTMKKKSQAKLMMRVFLMSCYPNTLSERKAFLRTLLLVHDVFRIETDRSSAGTRAVKYILIKTDRKFTR